MKFGILLDVQRAEKQRLQKIAELGFSTVELAIGSPNPVVAGFDQDGIKRIRESCAAAELELTSLALGWHMAPSSPLYGGLAVESLRNGTFETLVTWLGVARDLGVGVLLVPFFGVGDLRAGDAYDSAKRGLKRLSRAAEAKGIQVGVESTLPAPQVCALMAEVDSPAVGVYYDVGNAMCLGYDPLEEMREISDKLLAIHLKEFAPDDSWKPVQGCPTLAERAQEMRFLNTVPLGEGSLPARDILAHLAQSVFRGPVTLELFPCPFPDPIELGIRGIGYLQTIDSPT